MLAIILIALSLRLFRFSNRPVFLDERASINLASLSPLEIFSQVAKMDPHPPLYYIFAHFWGDIVGLSVNNLRLASVFFGTLAVYGLYQVGRLLYSEYVGLFASLILALSPHHIASSQYARSYALFSVGIIFSFYFFWRLQNSANEYVLLGYVLSTAIMASVHVYGGFLVIGQWIYVGVEHFALDNNGSIPIKRFLKSQVGAGLIALPSILVVLQAALLRIGRSSTDITHTNLPTSWVLLRTFGTFTGGRFSLPIGAVLLALFAICGTVALGSTRNIFDFQSRLLLITPQLVKQRVFLLCWGVPTVILPVIISFGLVGIWDGRSTTGAFLALVLIVADGVYRIKSDLLRIALLLTIIICSLLILPSYYTCYTSGFFC